MPDVDIKAPVIDLPDVDIKAPTIDLPNVDLKAPVIDLPEVDIKAPTIDLPSIAPPLPKLELSVPETNSFDLHLPTTDVDIKVTEVVIPGSGIAVGGAVATMSAKDIIPSNPVTPPSSTLPTDEAQLSLPELLVETPTTDNKVTIDQSAYNDWLASFDPHLPIGGEKSTQFPSISNESDSVGLPHITVTTPTSTKTEPTHGSKVAGGLFGDWLHKAKEAVEQLSEKAAPVASELLHKAKDLSEKATPVANDLLHKAKDTVEHLGEKATPIANDLLHKAKEVSQEISNKGLNSATLSSIATKLSAQTTHHRDDFQKLLGIDVIMENVLHKMGIVTYQQLAKASTDELQRIVDEAHIAMNEADFKHWSTQAKFAAEGEWEKLKAYQAQFTAKP